MLPEEKIEIHFEVPKNVLYSIRSQPVQVVIENASLDGVHLPRDAILKTSIKDYFKKDPRCELEAMESIVTIEFKNMTHESPNSPDAKNSDGVRFWGSALSNSVSDKSIFCDAEFQEDLYFEWPAGVPPGLRRMAGTIAGGLGLFTDVHPDDIPLAFRFDPVSFLWMMVKPLENFSIQEQMRRLTPPLMNRANWCVFGRGDCLSREAGDVSVREVVHLSRIAKGFLVPNIHNLFTPEGSLSESKKVMRVLRLRFHYYNNSNLSPVPLNEGRIPLRVNYIPPPL
jgi:hypothetical protein